MDAIKVGDEGQHSRLPWRAALTVAENAPVTWNVYGPRSGQRFNGECVAVCAKEKDAEFIAKSCNAYGDLLVALQKIDANAGESVEWIRRVTRDAIAKAEAE